MANNDSTIAQQMIATIAAATILAVTKLVVAIGRVAKNDDIWALPQQSSFPNDAPLMRLIMSGKKMNRPRPSIDGETVVDPIINPELFSREKIGRQRSGNIGTPTNANMIGNEGTLRRHSCHICAANGERNGGRPSAGEAKLRSNACAHEFQSDASKSLSFPARVRDKPFTPTP